MTSNELFVGLPKAELHLHLVGAMSSTMLAATTGHWWDEHREPTNTRQVGWAWKFRDFADFCQTYGQVTALLRSGDQIVELVRDVAAGLIAQRVRYAEITVTPASHLAAGVEADELGAALDAGRAQASALGLDIAWIFDFSANQGPPSGHATLDWVQRYGPAATVGFGVGGPEESYPRRNFAGVFDRAVALGLGSVPHAGETTTASEVVDAVEILNARRIGHGIAAAGSQDALNRLAETGVVLEVCPTSNLRTGACPRLGEHPLARLIEAGVRCTLASDDPGFFGSNLLGEVEVCRTVLGLSDAAVLDLLRCGIQASMAPAGTKASLIAEFEQQFVSAR